MSQFLLTSYERMRRYLAAETSDALVDGVNPRRELLGWIGSTSAMIESYCNRNFLIASYTEYFDVNYKQIEFFLKATPISSITSIYYDITGLFTGSESALSDYYIGTNDRSIVLATAERESKRGLRVIYTGGFGTDAVKSVFTGTITGTFTVGKFANGGTSYAKGIIRAVTATTLTIEVLYGTFEVGETITEWGTESAIGASTAIMVVTADTSRAICENYPDLVRATEMQIRYLYKNKLRFEDTAISKDGQSTRNFTTVSPLGLQPEVLQMLADYRRESFV
jgi:hypothetical protein